MSFQLVQKCMQELHHHFPMKGCSTTPYGHLTDSQVHVLYERAEDLLAMYQEVCVTTAPIEQQQQFINAVHGRNMFFSNGGAWDVAMDLNVNIAKLCFDLFQSHRRKDLGTHVVTTDNLAQQVKRAR